MNAKKFNTLFLSIVIAILSIITVSNYVIDPYGINLRYTWKGFNLHKPDFHMHTRQLKPYLSDIIHPNMLFLGTSRMEYLAPEAYFMDDGKKCFNFGLSAGTVNEMYEFLKYSKRNYDIEEVIYGLDFISFTNFSPDIQNSFDLELVEGKKIKFIEKLKMYLSMQAVEKSYKCIKNNIQDEQGLNISFQYNKYGSRTNRWRESVLKIYGKSWIKEKFDGTYKTYQNVYFDTGLHIPESKKTAYRNLMEYIKENKFKYTAFISPLFESQFKLLLSSPAFEDYIEWLEFVSGENGFYYMGGVNSYTCDTNLFWDSHHSRKIMSTHIFNTIYGRSDSGDELWGSYVDSTNFKEFELKLIDLKDSLARAKCQGK